MVEEDAPWWRSAVVYQIYPRSFASSDADGVGDLAGIIEHLDHLVWLGVDAVWLSPIYRSPMADFGYDVADHCDIDPQFGDLETFDRLLELAHERGLRVLLDWVPNHTSSQHPWFIESRRSRSSPKRDWYFWRDGDPETPPNNWQAAFGGRAWTYDEATEQWYLHLFLPEQPDLDWANPEVEEAMHSVLRFWLDRGVDGFRADVVHLIGKDPGLPDQPLSLADADLVGTHDYPGTHGLLRRIRDVLEEYPGERTMVGEVNLGTPDLVAPYYGDGDELPLVFNFALLHCPWDALRWAEILRDTERALGPRNAWPTWVLSNHDNPRHRSRYGGSERRARIAAVVATTIRGTPFLYQGEELGLGDADIDRERQVDPGGRDGCRAPIPWDRSAAHGWGTEQPWLPFPPEAYDRSVAAQRDQESSVLHLYRRLLGVRRGSPSLRLGSWELMSGPDEVLAYERRHGEDRRVVVANFGDAERQLDVDGHWEIEVSASCSASGHPYDGTIPPEEAFVLRPGG